MNATPARRRSRAAWPAPMTADEVAAVGATSATHDHPLPRWLLPATLAFGVVTVALVAMVVYLTMTIASRTEYRDEQARLIREETRQEICRLLDGLPASPLLDPLRRERGCGPGLPPTITEEP